MTRALVLVAALAAAGCGGSDANEQAGRGATTVSGRATGGGLSIQEAREHEGPVLVKGTLLTRADDTRLCSGLAESDPPQCAEPSLRVEGMTVSELEGREHVHVESSRGVTWTAGEVELRGRIEGGVLHVDELPG